VRVGDVPLRGGDIAVPRRHDGEQRGHGCIHRFDLGSMEAACADALTRG
jgi:hypothetical protein